MSTIEGTDPKINIIPNQDNCTAGQQHNIEQSTTSSAHQSYHYQRAPRTPESYFNVSESIALLNIVKSDRIQNAFQSNRKNHASVWEMVAEILSQYNNRKRSAKQCCNRYENLKKIYTQLKRNPEKHVRRNWPYMYLFRQIEQQRGESWGAAAKRRNELSYYQRRRALMLMNNNGNDTVDKESNIETPNPEVESMTADVSAVAAAAGLLNFEEKIKGICNNISNSETTNNLKDDHQPTLYIPHHFIQAALRDCEILRRNSEIYDQGKKNSTEENCENRENAIVSRNESDDTGIDGINATGSSASSQINLDNFDFGGVVHIKDEPTENGYDEQERSSQYRRLNNNYNGGHNLYVNNQINNNGVDDNEPNILHPDVIVDTDHLTDSSTSNSITNLRNAAKRKNSTTSSDEESTNYELIGYLKRREKRDAKMFKRMEEREERLVNLLERTVVAIERIASHNCNCISTFNNNNANTNGNNNYNNSNNNNNNNRSNILINKPNQK